MTRRPINHVAVLSWYVAFWAAWYAAHWLFGAWMP